LKNYDAAWSPLNTKPLIFSKDCHLNESDNSCDLVYSSHCFEHLDDEIVNRLLEETIRILKKNSVLVLKLPNWDLAIKSAFNKDYEWLSLWGAKGVAGTWDSKDLKQTEFSYAAMIFCSYWNEAYAGFNGHFDAKTTIKNNDKTTEQPYHGPPPMSDAEYIKIFETGCPRKITYLLRDSIKEESKFYFNHQNAWSNTDLVELMNKFGLQRIEASNSEIIRYMAHIPKIKEMDSMSNYFIFEN